MRIEGHVAPGFEPVERAFEANFQRHGEVGAGLVVRRHGEVVVDLWGGVADPTTGRSWAQDTPGVVFSATKGLVAMVFAMLADRGEVQLDAPLQDYWPELRAQATVRMLLNHRSGLSAIDEPLTLQDFDGPPSARAVEAMSRQEPLWQPDTDQGYAACAYGAYTAELVHRITGRSVGRWFADEIAGPLGLDAWIGIPGEVAPRVARLIPVPKRDVVRLQVPAMTRRSAEGRLFRRIVARSRSFSGRAFLNPTLGPGSFQALNDPAVQRLELPWMGAVSTADALSKAYAALIGEIDGVRLVRPEAILPLRHRQSWSERDRVMQKPLGFSQGFVKDQLELFSPNPAAFGHPGAGGALGWTDPDAGLAIGYVMNRMDWRIRSPRAVALCHAIYRCIR